MRQGDAGIALPLTLLVLLSATLLTWAGLGLVQDGMARLQWEVAWFLSTDSGSPEGLEFTHLGGGYHLERLLSAAVPGRAAHQRIVWCLLPDLEAGRASFFRGGKDSEVLGPLRIDDLGLLLASLRIQPDDLGSYLSGASLELVSHEADDFLLKFVAGPDVHLAVGRGTLRLQGPGAWQGLLILDGEVQRVGDPTLVGGVWQWGEQHSSQWNEGALVDDMEVRRLALSGLPVCPDPLVHIADLGRR